MSRGRSKWETGKNKVGLGRNQCGEKGDKRGCSHACMPCAGLCGATCETGVQVSMLVSTTASK